MIFCLTTRYNRAGAVKNAFVDINDNLTLVFENGESLVIKAAKEDTESYIVYRYKDFQVIH